MMRWLIARLILSCCGLVVAVVMLEIGFQFLPVSRGPYGPAVTAADPIFRFFPKRTWTWSKGPSMELAQTIRTNNEGFVSDIDYEPNAPLPIVAVIGDSYVEALMIPAQERFWSILNQELGTKYRFYAFATSGSALSQYIAYAQYVRDRYHPEWMIVSIVSNDFDESVPGYRREGHFHYFNRDLTPALTSPSFTPGPLWQLVRSSALLCYLYRNLELRARLTTTNTTAAKNRQRLADATWAGDRFLELLPSASGLRPDRIILMLDGLRTKGRTRNDEDTFYNEIRTTFMAKAREHGFGVADLDPIFGEETEPLDFGELDAHWNSYAHRLVADRLATMLSPCDL